MNSIYRYSNRSPKTKKLLLFLLLIYAPTLFASTLIARVDGEVRVKLNGFNKEVALLAGTLLPQQTKIALAKDASFWVLCFGNDKPKRINHDNLSDAECPRGLSDKMRAGDDFDSPFLLIPNQYQLSELDWLVWSGPGDAHYRVTLIQTDDNGLENQKESFEIKTDGGKIGAIHRYLSPKPFKQLFANNRNDGWELRMLVENLDNSRNSDENYDLIQSIEHDSASDLKKQAQVMLSRLDIVENTPLGRLVTAGYLIGSGHRSEAYTLLDSSADNPFRAQTMMLRVKSIDIPGAPADLVIEGYGNALRLAVKDRDPLNAVIACRGLFSKSTARLTETGKALQASIMQNPELSSYCFEFIDMMKN